MAFLAVSYPKLSPKDFDWIQKYRENYDNRFFSRVDPHFTLVFPVSDMSAKEFTEEVKVQSKGVKSFEFELNVATINKDYFGGYYHEFLVPDKGYSDIVKLHDKLYSDLLTDSLNLDIDFIPHVGIGNSDDVNVSKSRVDNLNKDGLNIKGTLDSIDIIEFNDDSVHTIERLEFL